jgi:hypothetical protein
MLSKEANNRVSCPWRSRSNNNLLAAGRALKKVSMFKFVLGDGIAECVVH